MNPHVDWKRLIQLRERGQRVAQEAVAADRRAKRSAAAETERAAAKREQQIAYRQQHIEQLRGGVETGRCDVAELRLAVGYIGVLDARIHEATSAWNATQESLAAARETLMLSQQWLRTATAELRAAQEMQARDARAQVALRDRRAEDSADESARQTWRVAQSRRRSAVGLA